MPLIPLAFALLVAVGLVLALPFSILQRYRLGTARRRGRKWVGLINLAMLGLSAVIFLWAAALTNFWIPKAFLYSLAGIIGGAVLGWIGLILTRWEEKPGTLHYTPNRWLILLITVAVTARLLYGFWRGWQAWDTDRTGARWLAEAGASGSLAVGAIVLGYYFIYTAGVVRRLALHRKQWGQVIPRR